MTSIHSSELSASIWAPIINFLSQPADGDTHLDLDIETINATERIALLLNPETSQKTMPLHQFFSDLEQLRQTVQQTGRIWSIDFSERFEVPAVTLASQLVSEGAIGDVIHTLGLGPHRLNANSRPNWFFDPNKNGGILADIGSHQIDQFLYFTKSERAEISLASIRNMGHKEFTNFSDFGEISLRSEKANGYIRLDWFTPGALPTWGDGRLFLLGTDGSIEIRKYCDIGSEADDNYVYLTNSERHEKIYGGNAGCPYFYNFLVDVLERSETAMPQKHPFKVMELAIQAQQMADGEKRNELV